jgi:hypothetical protein
LQWQDQEGGNIDHDHSGSGLVRLYKAARRLTGTEVARSRPSTGRVFVRHEPNPLSGGQVADIEIGAFLIATGNGPEKQELLRLIGTLV